MPGAHTGQPHQTALSLIVTRADGTIEDLGVVAYSGDDPAKVAAFAQMKKEGRVVDLLRFFGLKSGDAVQSTTTEEV